MRMLMKVRMATAEFNTAVKSGSAPKIIDHILEECAAEAVYFTEEQGRRTALLVVNIADASQIPRFAEPWFLNFNAEVEFSIAMTPDDLKKSGLSQMGQKWR